MFLGALTSKSKLRNNGAIMVLLMLAKQEPLLLCCTFVLCSIRKLLEADAVMCLCH